MKVFQTQYLADCSPHTRGWPGAVDAAAQATRLFPAHAGMARAGSANHGNHGKLFPAHAGMARPARQ